MTFNQAVKSATDNLLKSDKARTYTSQDGKQYTLDIVREDNDLIVTTWGWDDEGFIIPQNRAELIRLKTTLQTAKSLEGIDKVALRYYLDILYRESE